VVIGGRRPSLSRAVRAGDVVFLTGQVPRRDGVPMTDGTIEAQTHAVLRDIEKTLAAALRSPPAHRSPASSTWSCLLGGDMCTGMRYVAP